MEIDFHLWSADQLADYIATVIHPNIQKKVDEVKAGLLVMTTFHSPKTELLFEAKHLFWESMSKMESHLKKEAAIILPIAKRYVKELEKEDKVRKPGLRSACPSIHEMYQYHKTEDLHFDLILIIIKKFEAQLENLQTYKDTCMGLLHLKRLWNEQVKLENDVLFPKIVEMEALLYPNDL